MKALTILVVGIIVAATSGCIITIGGGRGCYASHFRLPIYNRIVNTYAVCHYNGVVWKRPDGTDLHFEYGQQTVLEFPPSYWPAGGVPDELLFSFYDAKTNQLLGQRRITVGFPEKPSYETYYQNQWTVYNKNMQTIFLDGFEPGIQISH